MTVQIDLHTRDLNGIAIGTDILAEDMESAIETTHSAVAKCGRMHVSQNFASYPISCDDATYQEWLQAKINVGAWVQDLVVVVRGTQDGAANGTIKVQIGSDVTTFEVKTVAPGVYDGNTVSLSATGELTIIVSLKSDTGGQAISLLDLQIYEPDMVAADLPG